MSKKPVKYEFHTFANIFPLMQDKEFQALKNDIALNGLREPVYLFQDKIIDGRNRYKACLEIGIEPVYRQYTGTENELIEFVLSLNLHRRHLSTSQKACLAVESLPDIEKRTKENLSKQMKAIRTGEKEVYAKLQKLNSNQIAGELFGISERYVSEAKKLKKESESLFNQVKAGTDNKLTINKALKQLQHTEVIKKATEPAALETIVLSKNQIKRINELVSYGMPETKAREYIINRISNRAAKHTGTGTGATSTFKELKIRIPESYKKQLQSLAKEQHKSLSELLREFLKKSLSKK